MNIKVTPVINVGTKAGALIPVHHVQITDESGVVKTLLVNYSFGKVIAEEGMNEPFLEYENDVGVMKERLFNSISDLSGKQSGITVVVYLEEDTEENIGQQIKGNLERTPGGTRLLMVWDRGKVDDRPFYEVLGLAKNGVPTSPTPKPVSLAELGYTVAPPFYEMDLTKLSVGKIVRVGKR